MKHAGTKAAAAAGGPPRGRWLAAALVAAAAAYAAYGPALDGPFVFDDLSQPFLRPDSGSQVLSYWLRGVRPVLSLTFWLNLRLSGVQPYSYHLLNLLLHLGASVLAFLVARKLLDRVGESGWRREVLAVFAGGLFLLHPVQTESVAYVASRSECLSVFLFYAAFAVFLYRRTPGISFPTAAAVLALFGAACLSKEHTVILPALLLVTDYYWNPGFSFKGALGNWRLYLPMAAAGAAGGAYVRLILSQADTAGFRLPGLSWDQYFLTQCRAIWVYLRLYVLPFGQNIDPEFPISRHIVEHGAAIGLTGLAALIGAAIWWRRRAPLASYGVLAFLLLLAPTSSFLPIRDPLAERRLYLPMIGLLLATVDLARRWKTTRSTLAGTLAAVLAAAGLLTWQRNHVWGDPIALWGDTAAKSPHKARPHFQLAYAYYSAGRCPEAAREYAETSRLEKPDQRLLIDWALAHDCAGQTGEALAKLLEAARFYPQAHAWALIGMIHGKQGRAAEALDALARAEAYDARFAMTYFYRGNVFAAAGDGARAAGEYHRALSLNPDLQAARDALGALARR